MDQRLRQYILGVAFIAVFAYTVGTQFVLPAINGPLQRAQQRNQQLRSAIQTRQKQLAQMREWLQWLTAWEQHCLPADVELAGSLYREWLFDALSDAELRDIRVSVGDVRRSRYYMVLPCSVHCRGSLSQLVSFLYRFYRCSLLHQISSISLLPIQSGRQVDISLSLEALILPTAVWSVKDTQEASEIFRKRIGQPSRRLAFDSLTVYQRAIGSHSFFSIPQTPYAGQYTYLTGISYRDNVPEAWITDRATDRVYRLQVGDSFRVGVFNATIVEILPNDVVFEMEGERWLITVGESLSDATALPPEY